MISYVQVVFLIDINYFNTPFNSEDELESCKRKLLLGCLRLLTEFGAQTDKGSQNVRWSFKFYDSRRFKPDISQKVFVDFTKQSFETFDNELVKIINKFQTSKNEANLRKKNLRDGNEKRNYDSNFSSPEKEKKLQEDIKNSNSSCVSHPHSFIINKSLQEILLDYNWDTPDISSPVRTAKSKLNGTSNTPQLSERSLRYMNRKSDDDSKEELNFVIAFTFIPHSTEILQEFIGKKVSATAAEFFKSIFDDATFNGFKEEKALRFHLVNISKEKINPSLRSSIQSELNKLKGGLHEIENIVQDAESTIVSSKASGSKIKKPFPKEESIKGPELPLSGSQWWNKRIPLRGRVPQPGPSLTWEDAEGTSFIKISLEILAVHGSSSKEWGNISVKCVTKGNAMGLLGIGLPSSHLYVCHAPDTAFPILLSVLSDQNLIMILQLENGGFAGLAPWVGGVGCLVIFSVSGIISPTSKVVKTDENSVADLLHDPLLSFVRNSIKRCLKKATAKQLASSGNLKRMVPQVLKSWYPPLAIRHDKMPVKHQKVYKNRELMLERLQKKYRPQMPRPLSGTHLPPPALIDATVPSAAAAGPEVPSAILGKAPSAILKSKHVSRAQKLVKESKMFTAQMKVKELQAEEQEKLAASERKIVEAQKRAKKSLALVSKTLKSISNPQDKDELAAALINIRDNSSSPSKMAERNVPSEDLCNTARTIVNLLLVHIRTHFPADSMERSLHETLSRGVLLPAKEVRGLGEEQLELRQFKLQTLLHLEVLYVLGYSPNGSSSPEDLEGTDSYKRKNLGESIVEEILKLLRSMSLRHNPSLVGEFLQQTVAPNYNEMLGETLVEIFEELNQPLPNSLLVFTNTEDLFSPLKPSSAKSYTSSLMSNGPQSTEEGILGLKESTKAASRPVLRKEMSNRQIVVPHVKRPSRGQAVKKDEKKKVSSPVSKCCPNNDMKNVRRNLFDRGAKKEKLKRSHTVSTFQNHSKQSQLKTPTKGTILVTPRRSNRKRSLSQMKDSPSGTPSRSTRKNKDSITPLPKKAKVLAPETPYRNICTTIFNKQRLRKSTGSTVISESPDVKGEGKFVEKRPILSLRRRSSFYSGNDVSRNFEKGKQQLKSSRIKGFIERRASLPNTSKNSSFLFSEIIQNIKKSDEDCQKTERGESKPEKEMKCHFFPKGETIRYGLDFEQDVREVYPPLVNEINHGSTCQESPYKEINLKSPLKKVRRTLSLLTPKKANHLSNLDGSFCASSMSSPVSNKSHGELVKGTNLEKTGKDFNGFDEDEAEQSRVKLSDHLKQSVSFLLTPSKRVQFSFDSTPSKETCNVKATGTPKSILKTPCKSPFNTPSKVVNTVTLTPRSILKTPKKSPRSLSNEKENSTFLHHSKEKASPGSKPLDKVNNIAELLTPKISNKISPFEKQLSSLSSKKTTTTPEAVSKLETPTSLKCKYQSKIITQFRNATPSQFDALLHSPLSSSMKKRKPNDHNVINSATDVSHQSPSKNFMILSPCNSPFKFKSPAKGEFNWDFKPLINSPQKFLMNSSTEFEMTSPKKRMDHVKVDIVVHQNSQINANTLRNPELLPENKDETFGIKEVPLDQEDPLELVEDVSQHFKSVGESLEGKSPILPNLKETTPPEVSVKECLEIQPSQLDKKKNGNKCEQEPDFSLKEPEKHTKDGCIDSGLSLSHSYVNPNGFHNSNENVATEADKMDTSDAFSRKGSKNSLRDSDSGISLTLVAEDHGDANDSRSSSGDDIAKIISLLSNPPENHTKEKEPENRAVGNLEIPDEPISVNFSNTCDLPNKSTEESDERLTELETYLFKNLTSSSSSTNEYVEDIDLIRQLVKCEEDNSIICSSDAEDNEIANLNPIVLPNEGNPEFKWKENGFSSPLHVANDQIAICESPSVLRNETKDDFEVSKDILSSIENPTGINSGSHLIVTEHSTENRNNKEFEASDLSPVFPLDEKIKLLIEGKSKHSRFKRKLQFSEGGEINAMLVNDHNGSVGFSERKDVELNDDEMKRLALKINSCELFGSHGPSKELNGSEIHLRSVTKTELESGLLLHSEPSIELESVSNSSIVEEVVVDDKIGNFALNLTEDVNSNSSELSKICFNEISSTKTISADSSQSSTDIHVSSTSPFTDLNVISPAFHIVSENSLQNSNKYQSELPQMVNDSNSALSYTENISTPGKECETALHQSWITPCLAEDTKTHPNSLSSLNELNFNDDSAMACGILESSAKEISSLTPPFINPCQNNFSNLIEDHEDDIEFKKDSPDDINTLQDHSKDIALLPLSPKEQNLPSSSDLMNITQESSKPKQFHQSSLNSLSSPFLSKEGLSPIKNDIKSTKTEDFNVNEEIKPIFCCFSENKISQSNTSKRESSDVLNEPNAKRPYHNSSLFKGDSTNTPFVDEASINVTNSSAHENNNDSLPKLSNMVTPCDLENTIPDRVISVQYSAVSPCTLVEDPPSVDPAGETNIIQCCSSANSDFIENNCPEEKHVMNCLNEFNSICSAEPTSDSQDSFKNGTSLKEVFARDSLHYYSNLDLNVSDSQAHENKSEPCKPNFVAEIEEQIKSDESPIINDVFVNKANVSRNAKLISMSSIPVCSREENELDSFNSYPSPVGASLSGNSNCDASDSSFIDVENSPSIKRSLRSKKEKYVEDTRGDSPTVSQETSISEHMEKITELTPRRSVRHKKRTIRFESPIDCGTKVDYSPRSFLQLSPTFSSRRSIRSLDYSDSIRKSSDEDAKEMHNDTIESKNSEERVIGNQSVISGNESYTSNFSSVCEKDFSYKGRSSDSFEIVSPLKKFKETPKVPTGFRKLDLDSSNSCSRELPKKPIILRIRRKKKVPAEKPKLSPSPVTVTSTLLDREPTPSPLPLPTSPTKSSSLSIPVSIPLKRSTPKSSSKSRDLLQSPLATPKSKSLSLARSSTKKSPSTPSTPTSITPSRLRLRSTPSSLSRRSTASSVSYTPTRSKTLNITPSRPERVSKTKALLHIELSSNYDFLSVDEDN